MPQMKKKAPKKTKPKDNNQPEKPNPIKLFYQIKEIY
jgi:hypothetical protein